MGELKFIPFEGEAIDIKDKVTGYWSKRADSFLFSGSMSWIAPRRKGGLKRYWDKLRRWHKVAVSI